jgi:hypothetical protein
MTTQRLEAGGILMRAAADTPTLANDHRISLMEVNKMHFANEDLALAVQLLKTQDPMLHLRVLFPEPAILAKLQSHKLPISADEILMACLVNSDRISNLIRILSTHPAANGTESPTQIASELGAAVILNSRKLSEGRQFSTIECEEAEAAIAAHDAVAWERWRRVRRGAERSEDVDFRWRDELIVSKATYSLPMFSDKEREVHLPSFFYGLLAQRARG